MSESRSFLAGIPRLARLIRKELSESLRDRRTILTLVLMPVLLYPLLVIAFQQMMLSAKPAQQGVRYRVALPSKAQADTMQNVWKLGRESLINRHSRRGSQPTPLLKPMPELDVFTAEDLEKVVRLGEVDVGVRLSQMKENEVSRMRILDCEILLREESPLGKEVAQHLELLTTEANVAQLATVINRIPLRNPVGIVSISAVEERNDIKKRSDLIPVLVPLILILMTMTGAVYPAIDLTAGERERGTLEILVAAPIPRLAVLFAKYVAVLTVALLTALVNLGMMALTLSATGLGRQLFADSFTFVVLVQVLALLVLFAAFFSAVLLILTSFARSFKEAQAYLIPLMLFCLLPGMLALLPDLELKGPLLVVPLLNIVLLARDLFAGRAALGVTAVVVLSTLVYAVAAIATAARIFGTEAVLSSEQSGWGDFFRRPEEKKPRLAASAALLCMALMFPTAFLLVYGIATVPGLPLEQRLLWGTAGNLVVFVAMPAVALWRSRVPVTSGLRMRSPPALAWLVAVMLGVSLWPWALELILLLQRLGLASLGSEFLDRSAAALEQWRELSPIWFVAIYGVLVPVVEEWFFRGCLFEALLGEEHKAMTAVVGSAALFAVFHIFTPGGLAVERLLTSFLMGLVLGWLALVSRSVWPGVVLHVLHNSIGVLGGYYKPQLEEAGWLSAEQERLPGWALATAAGVAATGLLGLVWLTRRKESEPARVSGRSG